MADMRFRWAFAVVVSALAVSGARAQAPEELVPDRLDARVMAARIDEIIAARWRGKGVQPAELASDAEFFRRLSLDLNGRIPTITQLKDFLDDRRPNKKALWVEELMRGRENLKLFEYHFANYYRTLLYSQSTNQQAQFLGFQADPLIRRHLSESHAPIPQKAPTLEAIVAADKPLPWDKLVRELLTTPQGNSFFQANEGRPETIAGATSRLFLGVKLECAQCHDDKSGGSWTREQFWEFTAFFSGFNPQRGGAAPGVTTTAPKIKIPDKNITVEAKFLDGRTPEFGGNKTAVAVLADWMTAADNPFFARAAVNRMWYYFLGTGLTDPVDHMASEDNPPSHPELLDELAAQFVANGYDLKWLIRSITGTRAYQLSSRRTTESLDDERLFVRMAVRGMSPEQLFDTLSEATGYRDTSPMVANRGFGVPQGTRAEFLAKFTNTTDKRTETQTSILQALFLMNGGTLNNAVKNSKALKTVQDNTKSTVAKNIEELYLITLSRKPQPHELERLVRYVETRVRAEALADVFWALLNSSEFALNH